MKNTDLIAAVGGIEKARGIVAGAPDFAFGYDCIDAEYIRGGDIQDGYSIDDYEGCICLDDLRTAISEHDRAVAKPEFKKGDLFIHCDFKELLRIERVTQRRIYAYEVDGNGVNQSYGICSNHKRRIRHATPAEIKADHRIDGALTNEDTKVGVLGDSDDVSDIAYHVSPNAKVSER